MISTKPRNRETIVIHAATGNSVVISNKFSNVFVGGLVGERYGYECIRPEKPCKLYFDIEWLGAYDPARGKLLSYVEETFCGNITSILNVSCVAADIAMFAREASSSLLQSALDLVPKRSRLISSMFLLFFLRVDVALA
jgi:hypothetical protein